jgi:hypothetical protein
MTKDEALTLALEALKEYALNEGTTRAADKAIAAIEAVLPTDYRAVKTYHEGKPVYVSQPEQEPVAWRDRTYGTLMHQEWLDADPLYTTPPQRTWVGLTDEEIDYLYVEHRGDGGPTAICEQFAKAYEAYLKEKNT